MTMPHEEVRALKWTREFLSDLANGPRMPMLVLRQRARDCLHHYPLDPHIEQRWSDDVCNHGDARQFCQKCLGKVQTDKENRK